MVSLRKCSGLSCAFEPWLTMRQLIKLVLRESEPGLDRGHHRDPMEEPVAESQPHPSPSHTECHVALGEPDIPMAASSGVTVGV